MVVGIIKYYIKNKKQVSYIKKLNILFPFMISLHFKSRMVKLSP